MDKELLAAACEIVDDARRSSKLTAYYRKRIAYDMIVAKKIGDEAWLKRQIDQKITFTEHARKQHAEIADPCTHLHLVTVEYLKRAYGTKVYCLLWRLNDPEAISSRWALQFCATVNAIGYTEVSLYQNPYKFVTSHEAWGTIGREARNLFSLVKELIDNDRKRLKNESKRTDRIKSGQRKGLCSVVPHARSPGLKREAPILSQKASGSD